MEFEIFPSLGKDDEPKAMSVRLLSKANYVPIDQGKRKAYGD